MPDAEFRRPPVNGRRRCAAVLAFWLAIVGAPQFAFAQTSDPWAAGAEAPKSAGAATHGNTTIIERAGEAKPAAAPGVKLVALLTADGQQIDQGVVWRIYQHGEAPGKSKLVSELRQASPSVKLPPGEYTVNAAFGRAHLTKKVVVESTSPQTVQFVLNAGGLRMNALVGGKPAPPGAVSYAIYSDDRDQFENRTAVMSGAKPNLIIRLNAGIYRIVSTYGDANARVETDVTVEAGKLTEATVTHAAGRAMFKLVTRAGGEAIPDTTWSIQLDGGEIVKESVGALPSHYLAPGQYAVAARSGGQVYGAKFEIKDGESAVVEVMKGGGATVQRAAPGEVAPEPSPAPAQAPATAAPDATGAGFNVEPLFDIKSP